MIGKVGLRGRLLGILMWVKMSAINAEILTTRHYQRVNSRMNVCINSLLLLKQIQREKRNDTALILFNFTHLRQITKGAKRNKSKNTLKRIEPPARIA